ncbi:MAG: hypothetical protein H7A46_22145 [Verrucomicrobiales bacterium]|nr:hypothetical protein [Verrucomicrobiales bacterium]
MKARRAFGDEERTHPVNEPRGRPGREVAGVILGGGAVLLWSLSSACIVGVGQRLGAWQFLAVVSLIGGGLQVVGQRCLGRELRSLLVLPWRLGLAVLVGFVLYLLLYTTALVSAPTEVQAMGVNLMNYLWPTLAILFTTWWVPGERMHRRLMVAIALSLGALLLANGADVFRLDFRDGIRPYLLGGGAAVSWAAYCALMSRWRSWASDYAATPLGFLLVGIVASLVCGWRGEWQPMEKGTWVGVLVTALGPWAGGYMLWEMALHRVSGVTLGLMGAVTPVLSTLNLLGLYALTAPGRVSGTRVVVLIVAALLMAMAIALGASSSRRTGQRDLERKGAG